MPAPTLLALLQKGYFARELPPTFKTESYGHYVAATGAGWSPHEKSRWRKCVAHNLARPGGLRRPLKLPNPVPYFVLAELITNNWAEISAHTWKTRFAASRPYVLRRTSRAVIPRYHYGELPRIRSLRRRGRRYLLRTDIDQFYPSIYSHAIPWALHTKATCKANLRLPGKGAHLLGNQLDKANQNMNDGQTRGIPIGPDTSLVLAEILLASVDEALEAQYPGLVRGYRYVDDYEFSFGTLSDAEQILTGLQGLLGDYELLLNPRKTSLSELPAVLEDNWSADLARFNVRDSAHPVAQRNDLVALFSKAFETAERHPADSVLRYAVSRSQNLDVEPRGWRTFQNCLLGAATADSSTLTIVLGTMYQVGNRGGHAVAKAPLSDVFESIIRTHAPRGQGSEVAWALWGAISWNVALTDTAAEFVSRMDDNVVALLALHAEARGIFTPAALNKDKWTNIVNQPDVLSSEHWLLGYEANQQGWLVTPAVGADPIFSAMAAARVSFYDLTEAKPQFPLAGRGISGGRLPNYYA